MYRIEGDGSYQRTLVWRDGALVPYKSCHFWVGNGECHADIDGISGTLDSIMLTGIYMIIGQGTFANTRIIFMDSMLRGVQSLRGEIVHDANPLLTLEMVMLPNIVENP